MNKILQSTLRDEISLAMQSMSLESFSFEIEKSIAEYASAFEQLQNVNLMRQRLVKRRGISQNLVMESYALAPGVLNLPLSSYPVAVGQQNYEISLEALEGEQKSLLDRIKELIKKIVDFAINMFNKVKDYVLNLFSVGEQNKSSLKKTQLLLDQAKAKANGEQVATEGYSTGTIPLKAPRFLHMDYSRIIKETGNLEHLASTYFKDTVALLTLQFTHCKRIIEAYHRLMSSGSQLEDFDQYCRSVVSDCESRFHEMNASFKAFDCIEIIEDVERSEYSGVLKYRVSIKPPAPDDMSHEQVNMTTNLMKVQDLQDQLTSLNDEMVKYAKEVQEFFSRNSKIFLETINKLNDSATKSKDGTFSAHSDYIVQVHSFLVKGNLIRVVMGLATLNKVWKSVHNLNTTLVQEFMRH